MSRPRKVQPNPDENQPPKPRQPRIDPTPVKVYFTHFVSQLFLGAILSGKDVVSVFICDTATHNYSDMTEVEAMKAAAKKMFKARANQSMLIAQFANVSHATAFLEVHMDEVSTSTSDTTEPTPEELTA